MPDQDTRPRRDALILVVCTGNIARSPFAMALLEGEATRRLGDGAPIKVTSAGVHGLTGQPAMAESIAGAAQRGLDLTGHVASAIKPEVVQRSDLILAMTEDQRDDITQIAPDASRKTFTLTEFARLIGALKPVQDEIGPADRVRLITRVCHGARAYVGRPHDLEDIRDPYLHGPDVHTRVQAEIEAAVSSIARVLFATEGPLFKPTSDETDGD